VTAINIRSVGSYLPKRMPTNSELPPLDSPVSEADIARLGVRCRGQAGEGEGIAEMATAAAEQALTRAGLTARDIDLIVLANWTQRRMIPEFAPRVQALLGADRAFAFDVSTACAGFVYGVGIASSFLQTGRHQRALVIAAETTSQRARPNSRATLVFGDGAGAMVLERGPPVGPRVEDWELLTDGRYHWAMEVDANGWVKTHIPQRELIGLATESFRKASAAVLERNGLTMDDVDWIVPHSGTAGVQAALVDALQVPESKVLTNFDRIGNTSSAAIPLALDNFLASGHIKPGQRVLSPTTGTGWYAAAMLCVF
jgi:3-oxoacyl-[acyl-carrier-protein] synthase-3